METLKWVNFIVGIVFMTCYFYQFVYIPISLFGAKSHNKKKKDKHDSLEVTYHNYAILICARNEQVVICDLIDSLRHQSYPQDKLHIFVMADNCTDNTADAARKAGATVYTRFNKTQIGKGYAMNALLHHIKDDYPEGFDGFFVFDADNVLADNYIEEMNKSFCAGNEVITSYRNSKNYGDNWISAGYALWFLRESRYLNQARDIIGASANVSGTGFLFSRAVAEEMDGWPFHMLTEDIEFSFNQISKGRKIAYCPTAELFDEQPVKFSQSFRQRLRWARGYWQVLHGYGLQMIKGTFHGNFACFDMAMNLCPAFILSLFSIVSNVVLTVYGVLVGDNILDAVFSFGQLIVNAFGILFFLGIVTTITEWKHIRTTNFKKILYALTFPIYITTYIPIAVASIFHNPSWKPIEHKVSMRQVKARGINLNKQAS